MKNNDESLLRQYIFGHGRTDKEEKFQSKGSSVLKSTFSKWKIAMWEQNLKDGSCLMTDYAAGIFGVQSYDGDFPRCLYGKGILSQQTEVAFRRAEYRLKAGEEKFSFEAVINTTGNMSKWFEISYCLEFDEDEMPLYAIGSAYDISAKKLLEQRYDDQIAYRNGLCANTLNCMRIDLTEDRITEYNTPVGEITEMCALFPTADACLRKITEDMVRQSDIKKYKDVLTTEGLLSAYNNGHNRVVVEYYDTMLQKWLQINFVILKNPSNYHIDCFGICNDISETKLLEIALNNVAKQDYASIGIIDTLAKEYLYVASNEADGPQVSSYENLEEVFNYINEQWEGTFAGMGDFLAKEKVSEALGKKKEYSITYTGRNDDRRYQIYLSLTEESEQLIMVAIRDITDDALLEKLRFDATHDHLTGLYNREKAIVEANQLLKAHPDETFMIVHFDIQKFRLYNSFFGEEEGDRLLKFIADMFRELYGTHKYGVYGRIEADVFFLCFPYVEGVVEKNQEVIRERLIGYRSDFQVAGSCGIYIAKDRHLSAEAMFNRAAVVAKDNKKKQLNPTKYFDKDIEERLRQQQDIAMDMQKAIERREFEVYLQPKYRLFSGEASGAEALVRWNHPVKGLIGPDKFIPLFESNGFIIELDQYMWEQVCMLLRRWIDEGKNPTPVSVNMSRVSMYSPQTVPVLKKLVEKYNIPDGLLDLELTESAYMDAPEEMKARLEELRAAGFKIMMDDFGSGYSSLNTLRELPFDYLKVDRIFLASIDKDKRSRQVLASVVHMASRMGIPVITEGVETEEQRNFLVSIGCDYVQGFLYAKPMPAAEYEKRIIEQQERYVPDKESNIIETANIATDFNQEVQTFSNLLPYAHAFVEMVGNAFSYISANSCFLKTFGLHRDVMTREELIAKHLTEEDYEKLYDTYKRTADTMEAGGCMLDWKHDDDTVCRYMVQVQYVGKGEYAAVLMSSFIDLTSAMV